VNSEKKKKNTGKTIILNNGQNKN